MTKNSKKAFTLVETLVSIFLISMVLVGPLTVIINSVSYARNSRDVITATALAEESIELLRFKRDSLLVACLSSTDTATCPIQTARGTVDDPETPSEASWRMFKTQIDSETGGSSSCFVNAMHPEGCAYDVLGMLSSPLTIGARYSPTSNYCKKLVRSKASDKTKGMYFCAGSISSGLYDETSYKREVKLVTVTRSGASLYDESYNDDIRVESLVSFRTQTGLLKTVKVVDFIHARP